MWGRVRGEIPRAQHSPSGHSNPSCEGVPPPQQASELICKLLGDCAAALHWRIKRVGSRCFWPHVVATDNILPSQPQSAQSVEGLALLQPPPHYHCQARRGAGRVGTLICFVTGCHAPSLNPFTSHLLGIQAEKVPTGSHTCHHHLAICYLHSTEASS